MMRGNCYTNELYIYCDGVPHAVTTTQDIHLVCCLLKHLVWARKFAIAGQSCRHLSLMGYVENTHVAA